MAHIILKRAADYWIACRERDRTAELQELFGTQQSRALHREGRPDAVPAEIERLNSGATVRLAGSSLLTRSATAKSKAKADQADAEHG